MELVKWVLEEYFSYFFFYVSFVDVEHKQHDDGSKMFIAFGFVVQNIKTMELGEQMLLFLGR
jgi:hypothetical protein